MNRKRNKSILKTLTLILKLIDLAVIIGAATTSARLSVTGVGLIVVTNFAGIACALSLGNRVINRIKLNEDKKHRKLYEKNVQTLASFDKFYIES